MDKPPPLELTEADLADKKTSTSAGEPPRWRQETPAKLPGETPAATPRRKVFVWLLGLLLICGGLVSVMTWLRPAPKPYFAPVWLNEYQYHPFQAPPFSKQDQTAFLQGDYFAKGRIQLTSLKTCSPADTVVLYLSAYAVCNENGQVLLLPVDADPSAPQAFRPLKSVLQNLHDSPAQKKLLVLDICWPLDDAYWGQLDAGVAAGIAKELEDVPDPQRLVLCSCAPGQVPLAAPELGRSVFSFFLEEGLRGWADSEQANPEHQGLVTVKNLAAYVQAKVEQWAKLHQSKRQVPILYGDMDDFPLVALSKGKPVAHLERPAVADYPDWLVKAWKTRDEWWAQERHRTAPWLFRQAVAAIGHTERGWQYGTDPAALKKEMDEELERLAKYYHRLDVDTKPEVLSIAQYFQGGKTLDGKWVANVKDLFKKVTEARTSTPKAEEGEKAAQKIVEEFVEKTKQVPDPDWTGAIVEVLAADPFPRRETVQLAQRLLVLRQAATKYAEAESVRRLALLADVLDESSWQAPLVRKALLLMRKGEQAAARSRSFPWFSAALESAAQKRYDAETLLFAHGYVSLSTVEPLIVEALREYDTLTAKQEILEDALRQMHDALALLPAYNAILDFVPAADPTWHDAVRATEDLQGLLKPPLKKGGLSPALLGPLVEDVRTKTDSLQGSMQQLAKLHAPDVLEDLLARCKRPDADVQTYRELLAQWSLPLHAPEMRARIWEARKTLAARLTNKILEEDAEIRPLSVPQDADFAADLMEAREKSGARAARSLALLRLAGLNPLDLEKLDREMSEFVSLKGGEIDKANDKVRNGYVLSFALRQAWAQVLAQQTAAEKDVVIYERVSRIAPGWIRLGAKEEWLARAAVKNQSANEQALWAWQADRYRYASQAADASPFVLRAAFALREYAPKQTYGFSLSGAPLTAELTPEKPAQLLRIPLRWQTLPKDKSAVSFQVFDPNEDWLQINPDLTPLDKLTTQPSDQAGALDIPLQVTLKPQAELSPAPRPAGVLFGVKFGGRTYYHKITLPLLPQAERLEIVVSADPKEPGVPLGDLRLRPSKERQGFYIYVNNLSEKSRNLIVELHANNRIPPGGRVEVVAAPKQATRVVFGASGPATKEPAPVLPVPDAPAKGKDELPELTTAVQIRVLDKDRPKEVVATRDINVDVMQPREYVRVPAIQFEPPSTANKNKNRLDLTVQMARKISGPPCLVELVIPTERIPGLKSVRTGMFRGELPLDGMPLKLFAGEFDFDVIENDTGVVYLTVDGIERAFIFRTTFAPVGEPTNPREEIRPALRLRSGQYYRTNTKFEAVAEVDNAPAASKLLVSLGRKRGDTYEKDISQPPLSPRQKRVGFGLRGSDGGLEFDTLLRDWQVPFEAVPVRGERVVQARLVDEQGKDLLAPVYQTVFFDDHLPERVEFVNLPKQTKRDVPYLLKATGSDSGTGIRDVAFFLAHPGEDGKLPPTAAKIDAKPSPQEPDVWSALVYWPADRKGPVDISVRFTNKLGLSTFAKGNLELVDFDPVKTATGTIEGTVYEGPRPQTGIVVVLSDAKGNKLAEQKTKAGGTFSFTNLAPGSYVLSASKPTSGRPLTAKSKVDLGPGKTETRKMELFL